MDLQSSQLIEMSADHWTRNYTESLDEYFNSGEEEEYEPSDHDMSYKMDHLMHSDTMILMVGLIAMILVGLIFRSLCLRLTSKNNRKELMRGGLKQMAKNMDHVTRAMSNDLDMPDSPRAVIRTYSNYAGKGQPAVDKGGLRMQAFTNSLSKQMEKSEIGERGNSLSIEMGEMGRGER